MEIVHILNWRVKCSSDFQLHYLSSKFSTMSATNVPPVLVSAEDPISEYEHCMLCEYEGHSDNSVIPDGAFKIFMEEIQNQVVNNMQSQDSRNRYVIVTNEC